MKAVLKFDLPDDAREHRLAVDAGKLHSCLWDIDQHCRNVLKHGDPTPEERHLAEYIRAMIRDAGVDLDA